MNEVAGAERLGRLSFEAQDYEAAFLYLDQADGQGRLSDYYSLVLLIKASLLLEKWDYGWRLLGESCRTERFVPAKYAYPKWRGESLQGKRIVAWGGGGLGDEIFYARYLSCLAEQGAQVMLDCPASLRELMRSVPGVHAVLEDENPAAGADYQVTTTELPMHFAGGKAHPWPPTGSYLHARPQELSGVESSGAEHSGAELKVGLVWAAHSHHPGAEDRTASLQDMAALASVPGVRFFSVQVGPAAAELDSPPEDLQVEPLASPAPHFAETARLVTALDLLISVDTSTANLGGALGVKTWVAVPDSPCWRWGLTGATTPWYPSVSIYRRAGRETGAWADVFAAMAADLPKLRGA